MLKKFTLTLIILLSISHTAHGMEIEKALMSTDNSEESILLIEDSNGLFDDALSRDFERVKKKKSEPETYVVKKGDNLFRIALNHEVQLEELMEWNELDSYLIHPGDELLIKNDRDSASKENLSTETNIATVEENKGEETSTNDVVAKSEKNTNVKKDKDIKQSTKSEKTTKEPDSGYEMTVVATAYTAYCEGCSGTTAIGIDLRSNPNQKVVAVDPNVIPLGSRVWVEGYGEAIAGDTGGAIIGNRIDVFIPSHELAMQWGRKNVKLKVLN